MSGKKNNKYSSEFKQTIVNLYHSGKSYSQIHIYIIRVSHTRKFIRSMAFPTAHWQIGLSSIQRFR